MKPMLLTSVEELPVGDEWIYEAKYDGYRASWYGKMKFLPLSAEMATN